MLERVAGGARKPAGPILAAHNEEEALRLVANGLKAVGLAGGDLKTIAKGDPRKIAIAAVVKRRTIMGNKWIGRHLEMGAAARVSRYCSEAEGRPEVRRLMRRIEMSKSKDPFVLGLSFGHLSRNTLKLCGGPWLRSRAHSV